ncbi:MAG: TetR family transcriptional regulator [Ruminococcus sp.]|nr:TetR family transcriptional regulator [Ruminococcus sp.]MBQ3856001.1 TetR family transcriptional regulator [Ruminococcus sp.]HOO06838.1 TetR family transcriptional regulator [Ruminococcus sp.]HOR22229.1 TetR family transcriptional regulator [Ruminococcus sp.]
MPKGSPELTASRRDEIISACEKLYQTMSFKEITLKEISVETSFSRPSIYNYFQTKEEIFLAIMQREYQGWADQLFALCQENERLSPEAFAKAVAGSLDERRQLLKLLAMNHYDMEENSRLERLTDFKAAYGASLDGMRACLKKFFPGTDTEGFIFAFFPFLFGVYPYCVATQKQLDAMREAKIKFEMHEVFDIIFACVMRLLGENR